jgi:uncharacterized protein YkwD
MHSTTVRRLARLLPAVLAALMAASVPTTAHAASGCPGAGSMPAELGAPAVRTTTLCLLNGKRRANGLRSLRQATKLVRAAQRHSRDMVAHSYFAHDSRSGAGFSARIANTGWMSGRDSWVVGENLAWGGGTNATPRQIVASWMASAGHRANILKPRFHVIGIGVANGVPVANGGAGATYTTDFGS